MKKALIFSILALAAWHLQAQPRKKKVVFIIADGIPADLLEKTKTPNLDQIAKETGYKRAYTGGEKGGYSQTPTISAVGYNSLLTGTWANKHHVLDNDIKEPNYNYPTIFRLLKMSDSNARIAVFSTWEDNRTKLVGESLPQTGNIKVDYHFDGLEKDKTNYPHDSLSAYIHNIDEKVTDEAEKCIRDNGPDLTWVYLEYTDDMGHRYGTGPEMKKAIGYTDQQVGRIWSAIQYRKDKFPEDWLIVVTTDHGRDSLSGRGHGGQSGRERTTWIVTNAKELNKYYRDNIPAIVDIMPTIARFMDISIPRSNTMEIDGTPLIGELSIINPVVTVADNKLNIRWKGVDKDGNLKIWLTTTNNYAKGEKDEYKLLAELPVSQQSAIFNISSYPSQFYKVVLEAPKNTVNKWILIK